MVEPANFTDLPPRHRIALSLDLALLDWMDKHLHPGGLFGGASHAVERAIQRLKLESDFLQANCKKAGTPFRPQAFWESYAAEVAASTPSGGGRARHGQASTRGRVFASIATDLIAWVEGECIKNGPCQSLSQAVEVGLRSLRRGDHRSDPGALVEGMSLPGDALWANYQKLARLTQQA